MLKAWAFYLKKGTKKGQTIGNNRILMASFGC